MFIFRSPFTFQLWTYVMGHRQMLLRAPVFDEDRFVKNIDIDFSGVTTISIPTTFNGIEIALKKPSPNGYACATISLLDLKTNKEHFLETISIDIEENNCYNKTHFCILGDKEVHEEYLKSARRIVSIFFTDACWK
jgi:hypothetical protein